MEAEDVGVDEVGECLDVVEVLLVCVEFGYFEDVFGSESVCFIVENFVIEVVIEQRDDESPVFVVGDSSSVVALGNQILQGGEGYFFILVDEHLELSHGNTQI